MFFKKKYLLPFCLFMFSCLVIAPQLKEKMYTETDPYIYSLVAQNFKETHDVGQLYTGLWLPLHSIFISGGLHIIDSSVLAPRIVTAIFSSFSVVVLYYFSRQAYDLSHSLSTLVALVFLFFPYRFLISTYPFSEHIFIFFFLLSITFFIKDKPRFFLGVLFFMLAQFTRYESWYLTPLLIGYVLSLDQKKNKKTIILLCLICIPLF